jgi:D-serine deaminase-like pyridoxal phosphate-dependent protein
MQLESIKTPSLVVDAGKMNRNAERMTARVKSLNVALRPHVKTHKCVEIARIQTDGNADGIMVSTLAEARQFLENGFTDMIYGVPIEVRKFAEAIAIAKNCERFSVLTDDAATAKSLNEAARRENVKLDVFVKIDCGYHRCGVEPHATEAIEIPRLITDSSNLNFSGILTHAGHSYHARAPQELLAIARAERDSMSELARRLKDENLDVREVSIGSTPTMSAVDNLDGITEFRCGNYIFYDAFQATLGSCSFDDCALTVLTAIVHRDFSRRKIVVDAGAIALSKDRGAVEIDAHCGYGRVLDLNGNDLDLRVNRLSQEHGEIEVGDEAVLQKLKVGSRLRILANHSCLTAAQHSHYHVLEGEQIVDCWEIGRGW